MIRTGIPMIDVFNSLVESQKLPIFSVAGEPYNELLARIALQAEVDIIILGGMGLKYDDYLYFRDTFEEGGALGRTDPLRPHRRRPGRRVPAGARPVPGRGASSSPSQGKRVLVLLTDMTNFADALKEIAITMEQIPSNRGYPGDLYSQLAARYEKAVDFDGAGSITVLAVHHHARRRRHAPGARQHRLHHRGPVLPAQRAHRAVRLAVAASSSRSTARPATTTARS